MPKTWYKVVIAVVSVILVIFLIGFGVLVLNEYFPEDREDITIDGESTKTLKVDEDINIITYNLGYLSLDNTQDFFMDGGKNVRPKSATNVTKNLAAIKNFIESQGADIYLLQEVDLNAKRSLKEDFKGTAAYAHMFNSLYIPYPFFNTVGHVESGLVTLNKYSVNSATRVAVPSSISWPKRAVMYKNCAIEERVKIEDSDKELIVYNLHLDAYGSGDKKTEQLDVLMEQMKAEYEKGNYVVAGGDFNQTFPGVDTEKFPIIDDSHYVPATLPEDYLPDNWRFAVDLNRPTSRLLNEVYSGNYENTQLYIIDGYILSPNVELVKVETIENNFSYSDHHPVSLKIKLK